MNEPQFKVGDRVAREIVDRHDMARRVGWKRGTVVGVQTSRMFTVQKNYFIYTVQWDGRTDPDGGHLENGLVPEHLV